MTRDELTSTRNKKDYRWPENLRAIESDGGSSCATSCRQFNGKSGLKLRLDS
jgi:hypothetical protein